MLRNSSLVQNRLAMPMFLACCVLLLSGAKGTLHAQECRVNTRPHAPAIDGPSVVILGLDPHVVVCGTQPRELIRLHSLRRTLASFNADGKHTERNVIVHAWVDFRTDSNGRVDLSSAVPLDGSYREAGFNGLLWSGWPSGDERLVSAASVDLPSSPLENDTLMMFLEIRGKIAASKTLRLLEYSSNVRFADLTVQRDGLSGVFAYKDGTRNRAAVILLHGSEGGSMDAAREWAGNMAEQGFSALALNYVAYSWAPIAGVSDAMANVPIETLDRARLWLIGRTEVDGNKIGLLGVSKGAELALVGASHYPWVKAVVGCVPSDTVWAGYGRDPRPGELISSWSLGGTPIPFVPYDHYEDVFAGKATAAEVHSRSWAKASEAERKAAQIPVENIRGHMLLLGAGKDEVWPSELMVGRIADKLAAVGRSQDVEVHIFPNANHFICGTGTDPVRAAGRDRAEDAQAASRASVMTRVFLDRWLR